MNERRGSNGTPCRTLKSRNSSITGGSPARSKAGGDAGHGECVLRDPSLARLAGDTLAHFDGERYAQIAWVVMPNHIHALVVQHPAWPLEKLLHSWKSFSSKALNERLGREGAFWQRDYFDRLVRDEENFANCVRYIRRNPRKARLREGEYLHFESEMARAVADHEW